MCSGSQARIVSEGTRGSTQDDKHWKAINKQALYYYEANTSKHQQEGNTRHRTYRRERLLTGSVEYSSHTTIPHVYGGSSCLATGDQQRLLTWHITQAWHRTQTWEEVKDKVNYLI